MKNHYKIHAQNYEHFDHDQDDRLPPLSITDVTANSNESKSETTTAPRILKTEILDWLRSDFDDIDMGSTTTTVASDRVTRSMKKLCVEENKDELE
ncbi:unnamed protein product, partial [Rotaria sp. Silwood2]